MEIIKVWDLRKSKIRFVLLLRDCDTTSEFHIDGFDKYKLNFHLRIAEGLCSSPLIIY